MNEEIDNEEKPQVNFYKLDKTQPYKTVYSGSSSYSGAKFLIIFSVVYLCGVVAWTLFSLVSNISMFSDVTAIIAPVFLAVLGSLFLGLGIRFHSKEKKLKCAESEVLKDCILTDGRITEYKCIKIENRNNTSYDVELEYSFYDKSLNLRNGRYRANYKFEPQFYKGQYLMIAFNETDSVIMSEFKLENQDAQKFSENENLRSADDFDGITGELLDVDLNRPIKDYQYSIVWFWAAFAVFIFFAAYTVPMSMIVVPQLLSFGTTIAEFIGLVGIYFLPAILLVVIILLLKNYFKRAKYFKKILNSQPLFTFGKMFASEKTYRGSVNKKVFYCYIDKWGEKHTETVTSPVFHSNIDDQNIDVIVAYTAAGDSTVILDCKFLDEE